MGASVMDLITYTARFPVPGETLCGKQFRKGTGGKAANACVMSARLGLSVALLAKIGEDIFGSEMIDNFKEHDINIDNVLLTKEAFTSTANICVTDSGQNSVVYVAGAANLLTPQELSKVEDKIFTDCKLFVTTFECIPQTLQKALSMARKQKVTTLVSAAPPFSDPLPKDIYSLCDILCLNEVEASLMTGLDIKCISDAKRVSQILLERGCGSVIITMGENGAIFMDKQSNIHIPIEDKVIPIDTTGAGDCFLGSLAYYLVCHPLLSFEEKIKRCNRIASKSVQKQGTQSSYPYKHELPNDLFQ